MTQKGKMNKQGIMQQNPIGKRKKADPKRKNEQKRYANNPIGKRKQDDPKRKNEQTRYYATKSYWQKEKGRPKKEQ